MARRMVAVVGSCVVLFVAVCVGWSSDVAGAAATDGSAWSPYLGECYEYLVTTDGGPMPSDGAYNFETVLACQGEWPTGAPFAAGNAQVSASLTNHGNSPWGAIEALVDPGGPGSGFDYGDCGVSSGQSAGFLVELDAGREQMSNPECVAPASVPTDRSWVTESLTTDVARGPDEGGTQAISFVTVTRWSMASADWVNFYGGVFLSSLEVEGTGTATLLMPWTGGGDMASVPSVNAEGGTVASPVVEAFRLDSIQLAATTSYWPDWSLEPLSLPPTWYTGGGRPAISNAPCSLTFESLQPQAFDEGTSYSVTFEWTGAAGRIMLDPGPLATSSYSDMWELTADTPGGLSVPSYVVSAFSPSSPVTLGFRDKTGWSSTDADPGYPAFYCEDAGQLYLWGDPWEDSAAGLATLNPGGEPGTGPAPSDTGGGTFDFSECVAGASWDLFSPASWVTGAVVDLKCTAEWLLDPCPQTGTCPAVTSVTNAIGVTSSSPTGAEPAPEWLGSMAALMSQMPASAIDQVRAAADSEGCSTSAAYTLDVSGSAHVFSVCTALAAVSASGPIGTLWAVLEGVLTAGILVSLFLGLFGLFRRVIQGGSK